MHEKLDDALKFLKLLTRETVLKRKGFNNRIIHVTHRERERNCFNEDLLTFRVPDKLSHQGLLSYRRLLIQTYIESTIMIDRPLNNIVKGRELDSVWNI